MIKRSRNPSREGAWEGKSLRDFCFSFLKFLSRPAARTMRDLLPRPPPAPPAICSRQLPSRLAQFQKCGCLESHRGTLGAVTWSESGWEENGEGKDGRREAGGGCAGQKGRPDGQAWPGGVQPLSAMTVMSIHGGSTLRLAGECELWEITEPRATGS